MSEAKEVTTFSAQYKEAKRCRANEAYQLLARSVTFSTHAAALLVPVTSRLAAAGQPRIRTKLAQLLAFAARGVRDNPTAGPCELMVFVVAEMGRCLTREEAARARAKEAQGAATSAEAAKVAAAGPAGGSGGGSGGGGGGNGGGVGAVGAAARVPVLRPGSVVSYGKDGDGGADADEK